MRYRVRPREVEAICFDGENFDEVRNFAHPRRVMWDAGNLRLPTEDGAMVCHAGDWVVIDDELQACSNLAFGRRYEPVGDPG